MDFSSFAVAFSVSPEAFVEAVVAELDAVAMGKVGVSIVVAVVEVAFVFLDFWFEFWKRSVCFEETGFESTELPVPFFGFYREFFY